MNKKRLLELARHLEDGKLGHKKFDFSQYNNGKGAKCGTLGCALGELPILFPNQWGWDKESDPVLKIDDYKNGLRETGKDAEQFFDLDYWEVQHLFYPEAQNTDRYGGFDLDNDATKNQVASNIRDFVDKMSKK